MNLNPIISQRKNLWHKLWEDVHPQSADQIQKELWAYRTDFYEESGSNLPIEAVTTPALYSLCQSIKDKLNVHDDIVFQIDCRAIIQGNCMVPGNDQYPALINFSSGAINRLYSNELAFLIGHELGHTITKDGVVYFYYYLKYGKEGASKKIAHKMKVYKLLSELEADRYGYIACGSLESYISFYYKSRAGLDINKTGVSVQQFIEGNHKRVQYFINDGYMGSDNHPYDAIRIEAVNIYATSKDYSELCSRMNPLIYYIDFHSN